MLGPCWRNKPSATARRDESYWSAAIRTGDCSPTAQTCRERTRAKFHAKNVLWAQILESPLAPSGVLGFVEESPLAPSGVFGFVDMKKKPLFHS